MTVENWKLRMFQVGEDGVIVPLHEPENGRVRVVERFHDGEDYQYMEYNMSLHGLRAMLSEDDVVDTERYAKSVETVRNSMKR